MIQLVNDQICRNFLKELLTKHKGLISFFHAFGDYTCYLDYYRDIGHVQIYNNHNILILWKR